MDVKIALVMVSVVEPDIAPNVAVMVVGPGLSPVARP